MYNEDLSARVLEEHSRFEMALHRNRPFPEHEFARFFQSVQRYAEAMKGQELIHRKVAATLNGFGELLELEALQIPGHILAAIDRLNCMVFAGYDPHFEGDEPPGL